MIEDFPPELAGLAMAVMTAAVRILGDEKEDKMTRIFIESVICGSLSLTFSYAILALGLSLFWAAFVGGMIGYLGSAVVRRFALMFLEIKIGKLNKDKSTDRN